MPVKSDLGKLANTPKIEQEFSPRTVPAVRQGKLIYIRRRAREILHAGIG